MLNSQFFSFCLYLTTIGIATPTNLFADEAEKQSRLLRSITVNSLISEVKTVLERLGDGPKLSPKVVVKLIPFLQYRDSRLVGYQLNYQIQDFVEELISREMPFNRIILVALINEVVRNPDGSLKILKLLFRNKRPVPQDLQAKLITKFSGRPK